MRKLPENHLLTSAERNTLIIKVLQKNNWKELTQKMNGKISGKKEAIKLVRVVVGKLLN